MIRMEGLAYSIGSFDLNVTINVLDNEYFVLLGMTGSGKTLFLENLCGLRKPAGGNIFVDGQDITTSEPRDRGIGYVPQDGALFDHLDVRHNIGFALNVKGVSKPECNSAVEKVAGILHISHLLDRRIRGLSGGERQRVALGRAIVSRPRALILDEPVSALDEYTRQAVCEELKKVQREFGLSVIHVCHSFDEAGLVADRVGIMHKGRIIQTGTPAELYRSPSSLSVARILRLDNIFKGESTDDNRENVITAIGNIRIKTGKKAGVQLMVYLPPWEISIANPNNLKSENRITTIVSEIHISGAYAKIKTDQSTPVTFYLSFRELEKSGIKKGDSICLEFSAASVHLFCE